MPCTNLITSQFSYSYLTPNVRPVYYFNKLFQILLTNHIKDIYKHTNRHVCHHFDLITDCEPLPKRHAGGRFTCSERNFAAGSSCRYSCRGSKVPKSLTSTTCKPITNSTGSVITVSYTHLTLPTKA